MKAVLIRMDDLDSFIDGMIEQAEEKAKINYKEIGIKEPEAKALKSWWSARKLTLEQVREYIYQWGTVGDIDE